jgi:hypothetical protein
LLLALVAGCGRSAPTGDVSGVVRFDGNPLPSGTVAFVAEDGRSTSAMIDDGKYHIPRAPAGPVKITVQTFPPSPGVVPPDTPPASIKQPSLRYVQIPEHYSDHTRSGLTCTVEPRTQTHDIDLVPKK